MKPLPPMVLIVSVAVLCLGLMTGVGWLLLRSRGEAAKALAALKQKMQERDWLSRQSLALSPENEMAVSAELAATNRNLTEWRSRLQGDEAFKLTPPPPVRSTDAFIELADFIGQLRAKAGQAQVGLKLDECFGFAAYANEGPAAELIVAVHRQRLATQYLVEMLLESRPQMLLAVRRERPKVDMAQDQRYRTDDFFELDRTLSLRQSGLFESDAFRLEFTGQTETLRQFLDSIGTGLKPVTVRCVEVEPLVVDSVTRLPAKAPASSESVHLTKPGILKFGVIVELTRLATDPAAAP